MQELDQWSQTSVIDPLATAMLDAHESTWADLVLEVKKAIRTKVLQSYHNGLAAQSRTPGRKELSHAQAKTR